MKVVVTNDEGVSMIMVYIWGIKVVQWTVSYAPGGRSLRDVKAKAKVTPRTKIYPIAPDKMQNLYKLWAAFSPITLPSKKIKSKQE